MSLTKITRSLLGLFTSKGDLLTHDGTDHVRVPVGSDGQVLTADSGEAAGVKWAAAAGGGSLSHDVEVWDDSPYALADNTDFQDVTNFTITLPAAGTYLIGGAVRARCTRGNNDLVFMTHRLYDVTADAPIANSEVLCFLTQQRANARDETSTSIHTFYTVTEATTLQVQIQKNQMNVGGDTWTVLSASGGRSLISYLKIA